MSELLADKMISVNIHYGHVELDSWLQAEILPSGDLMLVGVGSKTEYDENGKIVSHTKSRTGVTAIWPAATVERKSWLRRIIGG